jgi:hypothetical protein
MRTQFKKPVTIRNLLQEQQLLSPRFRNDMEIKKDRIIIFECCFLWVWNLVSYIQWRRYVFWRPGRVFSTNTPHRNFELNHDNLFNFLSSGSIQNLLSKQNQTFFTWNILPSLGFHRGERAHHCSPPPLPGSCDAAHVKEITQTTHVRE